MESQERPPAGDLWFNPLADYLGPAYLRNAFTFVQVSAATVRRDDVIDRVDNIRQRHEQRHDASTLTRGESVMGLVHVAMRRARPAARRIPSPQRRV